MTKSVLREASYTVLFIGIIASFFGYLGSVLGVANLFSSIMQTAYSLLIETGFYIMAISVIMGAIGNLASEFGVVRIINYMFAPLMRPLYQLPGASSLGILTTYLSDNPAIITLAKDRKFMSYFTDDEIPSLCNLGTSFGMGLVLTTFMIGNGFFHEALIGNLGAVVGSVVSVRLMARLTRKHKVEQRMPAIIEHSLIEIEDEQLSEDSFFIRFMTAMLEGGKNGVDMGLAILPGLICVCTIIMTITFGPADVAAGYQGLAFEGVALLPRLGALFSPILTPLFGFTSPEAIAFPITSLGAVGAAMSLVPKFLDLGLISGNDIAVFTAMGMCWSGYLSTHVGMMDALNRRELISSALISHTIGGLVAGISAHLFFMLLI